MNETPQQRLRPPTRDELARYAKPGHACQGSGVITFQPQGGGLVTLVCRCAAKRMVRRHPGAFLNRGALFVDLDIEAAAQAEAAR